MLNTVQDFVKSILPARRKTNPSNGWISFDAPCCETQGLTQKRLQRGGITLGADGAVSYHCFNCGTKAHYAPGRQLTFKFKRLLRQMGADESEIKRLIIEAIRIRELINPEEVKEEEETKIEFKIRELPKDSLSFQQLLTYHILDEFKNVPPMLNSAVEYVKDRKIDTNKYEFYWSDSTEHSLNKRVIIPCIWEGKTIGYTSRTFVDDVKPKYYSHYEPNFVFNTNNQEYDNKFVIVVEGPFDAMAVDGVAIMSNECSEVQAEIIDRLGKEVIVVADRDRAGSKLITQAIEYGWSVSFPLWQREGARICKDVSEAVEMYGKLFVLKSIINAKETSKLKIELMRKKLYN